jgi:hypothetical protein
MVNGKAAEGRLFTVSLPSHAMVGVWSMRSWESARLPRRGASSDSQDRMDQTHMIAPQG